MTILTQIFYNKLCESSEGYLQSTNGRKAIADMARRIKRTDGRIECKYFLNLLYIDYVVE